MDGTCGWAIIGAVNDRAPRLGWVLLLGLVASLAASCSKPADRTAGENGPAAARQTEERNEEVSAPPVGQAVPPPPAEPGGAVPSSEGPLVVFLGDSLTAGLGIGEAEAFPEQIRLRLEAAGLSIRVVNAGVSGDTTAGGRARLDWVLRQRPDVLVVGLGANDGLRGLQLEETEANLREIVAGARQAGARALLLGMMLPPNYGPDYTGAFQAIFPRLAEELEVPLVPFLLDGVAGIPELNQADGIHPTAEGHRLMAGNVAPVLRQMLEPAPG